MPLRSRPYFDPKIDSAGHFRFPMYGPDDVTIYVRVTWQAAFDLDPNGERATNVREFRPLLEDAASDKFDRGEVDGDVVTLDVEDIEDLLAWLGAN